MKIDTGRQRIIGIFSKWEGMSLLGHGKWGGSIFSVGITNIIRIPDRRVAQFLGPRPRPGASWYIPPPPPPSMVALSFPGYTSRDWKGAYLGCAVNRDKAWEKLALCFPGTHYLPSSLPHTVIRGTSRDSAGTPAVSGRQSILALKTRLSSKPQYTKVGQDLYLYQDQSLPT